MEERKKVRYGKCIQIEVRAKIKENGVIRTTFFEFPAKGNFDSPQSILQAFVGWLFANFNRMDLVNIGRAAIYVDDREKEKMHAREKIIGWFKTGFVNEVKKGEKP